MTEAQNLEEAAQDIEQELGLKRGFFAGLLKEDDWSFVVKLESLIESACTYLLVKATNKSALEDVFSRLEIANKQTGKISFIKALGLLQKDDRAFIHELAELRNRLVHDVRNVSSFTFAAYVEKLDTQKLWHLLGALLGSEATKEYKESAKDPRQTFKDDSAKLLFWFGALRLLGNVYIAKTRKKIKLLSSEQLADYIDRHGGLRGGLLKELLNQAF